MAALPAVAADHPLAHLPSCGDCGFYLTAPQLCKGYKTPEYNGLFYRKCLHNFEPVDTSCRHFEFTDLPRGVDAHPLLQGKCPGVACKVARAPNPVNINCIIGLCKQCCIQVQATVPGLRSCVVTSHNEGRRRGQVAPPAPANPPPAPAPAPIPAPVTHPVAAPGPVAAPPAAAVAAPPAAAVAAPPAVAAGNAGGTAINQALLPAPNLPARDSVQINAAQDANEEARLNQQLAHTRPLKFWDVDGEASQGYTVPVPHWPGFHPKDCPELVAAYSVDTKVCQYWDEVRSRWWNCTPTSPPRNIKAVKVLYYRAAGVTKGIGMPGLTAGDLANTAKSLGKRRADDMDGYLLDCSGSFFDDMLTTPRKKTAYTPLTPSSSRTSHSWSGTPSSVRSYGSSVPPTPLTSSSRYSDTPGSSRAVFTPRGLSHGSPSPLRRSPSWPAVDEFPDDVTYTDSPPRSFQEMLLEATSNSFDVPSSRPATPRGDAMPSSSQSPAETVPTFDAATIDLSNAARGPYGWPFRYVKDMAAGFARMRYLEDHAQMKRIPAFEAAFGVPFKKSTFHQNFNAWNDAGERPGEQERWIAFGYDRRGEWSLFYQSWRRR